MGCDGLNVPLPSKATQNILERNASQNYKNLPEVDHMPVQNQSKSHCPSKMKMNPASNNTNTVNVNVVNSNTGTQMSKRTENTNNTFSDRV